MITISHRPDTPTQQRRSTAMAAPMIIAVALSLFVSIPTGLAITSGWLSGNELVALAAAVPVGLGVITVAGTAIADRSRSP